MTRIHTAIVGAVALLIPSAAVAQSRVTLVPSIALGSVYDDNLFAKSVASGDQMTLMTPSLQAAYETPITNLFGLYSFDMQRSIDHPALNNIEARRRAMFEGRFQRTPRFTFGLGGRYDSTDAAGELNFTTGLLLDRRRALRWQVGPSMTYLLGPTTTLTALYDRTAEEVEGTAPASEHVARLGVTRQLSPRAGVGVSYLGRHFVNGDEVHTSNAALLGWTYQVTPSTTFMLQAGPRASSRGVLAPEIVMALGRRVANLIGFALDYWRGESITLGVVGPVEVHSATAKVTWPIRRTVEFGLHGGVFDSATLTQGHARVYHTEVVSAWSPVGPLIIAASYGADFQRGDVRTSLLSDQRVVRHVFQIRMTAAPRLSRSFKPEDLLRPLGEPSRREP